MGTYDAAYRAGMMLSNGSKDSGYVLAGNNPYSNHAYEAESETTADDMMDGREYESGSNLAKFSDHIAEIGSKVLEGGKNLYMQQRHFAEIGEGPSLVRLLCLFGGFSMIISSALSMINLFSLFTGPSTYVLQIYQGFFGIIIMVVEAKDWDCLEQCKPWLTTWFRFLTVPAGKGAFYLFVGSLGISLWVRNFLAFTVGLYMTTMGVICIAVHAGTNRKQFHMGDYGDDVDAEIREGYDVMSLINPDPMSAVLDQTFDPKGAMLTGVGYHGRRSGYTNGRHEDETNDYGQGGHETTTATSGRCARLSERY